MDLNELDAHIAIIGAGPAGLTAGLYAARAMRKTILFERLAVGGQISTTHVVENYPGFVEGVTGPDLSFAMLDQAKRFGLEHRTDGVDSIRREGEVFLLETDGGTVRAGAVILCTGASHRALGLPKEKEFLMGRGVSVCATCDGAFFKGKDVVVVGGGDAALDEGLFLTKYCKRVTVVHRRDTLRASAILQAKAFAEPKMEFLWNTVVTAILGEDKVTGVRLKSTETGAERDFATEGLFIFIGHDPNGAIGGDLVERDAQGYVVVDPFTMETKTKGLFAAGDLRTGAMRQAITAAGDGCAAAITADRYLSEHFSAAAVTA